jgi:hypothetical protein
MDPSGNTGEFVGRLYDLGEILAVIEAMAKTGYSAAKQATPAGIATSIIFKPSKAGETEKDLKNDVEFQKFLSGGGTGDPNKGNKKKDKKDNKQSEKYSLKKIKNDKEANKIAKKLGYKGAEALKEDFVPRSGAKFNIKYDSKTHEIVLESIKGGIQVPTGLFLK